MAIDIDIAIEDPAWDQTGLKLKSLSEKSVASLVSILTPKPAGELSLAFVDNKAIQKLNRDYRRKDKPTNVLSFPMQGVMLGDIVLARQTIEKEASEQSKLLENHLSHLIVHGLLHLLGHDHTESDQAAIMEDLEIRALAQMGIDNPYEIKEPQTVNLSRDG